MADKLPDSVVWRREKMGFPFPISDWLLRGKASLLAEVTDVQCPFVDTHRLQRYYEAICQRDPEYLWGLLSISLWWRYNVELMG